MHRYVLAAFGAAFLCLSPAHGQNVGGVYNPNGLALSAGQAGTLQLDASGNLKVSDTSVPTNGTGGVTAVTVGTSSAQAVAAATRTARLAIQNVSASASIACSLGGTAALNTAGSFMIAPGQLLTLSDPVYVPGDALNCIASAAGTPAMVWSK